MYESFYGLKEKPFTLLPDPDYLYLSPKHHRALTLLEYGLMNHAGFSVICGDAGAGKTTLIRRLLTEMGDDTKVGLITNTHQSFGALLNWVLMAFGIDSEEKTKPQMHQMFVEFLIEQYAKNKRTILIVDEAQNMDVDTLEELRMLSNINADKDQIIQVILVGQLALRDTLRKPEMMQFAQRIAVDYYLESLNEDETELYIQHRLKVAGTTHPVFTSEACHAVYRFSGGTPRLINLLCDTALVYGFAEQTQQIDAQLVIDVVSEQHHNSIIPTFNTASLNTESRADILDAKLAATAATETPPADPIASLAERAQQAISETQNTTIPEPAPVENAAPQTATETETTPETPHDDNTTTNESDNNSAENTHIEEAIEAAKNIHREETIEAAENIADIDTTQTHEPEIGNIDNLTEDYNEEEPIVMEEEDFSHSFQRRQEDNFEDVYPIIHVDDNKKSTSSLAIGLIFGFVISLLLISVIGYFFIDNLRPPQNSNADNKTLSQHKAEIDHVRLQAVQKERDAALAISKALERERDAAIAAAKVQEEIHQAEKRAVEMVAEQTRKADTAMRLAEKRAQEAELAATRARKAERASKQRNKAMLEKQRLEIALKQQRQEALRLKQEADTAQRELAEEQAQLLIKQREKVFAETNKADSQNDGKTGFSINPCDSPSAKFLSTCKR